MSMGDKMKNYTVREEQAGKEKRKIREELTGRPFAAIGENNAADD